MANPAISPSVIAVGSTDPAGTIQTTDDDVAPFTDGADDRAKALHRFRTALDETGLVVPMATTNLFFHPMFKDGAFTSNNAGVRRYAIRKTMRNLDVAAELGALADAAGARP